jgi:hypothetical protein
MPDLEVKIKLAEKGSHTQTRLGSDTFRHTACSLALLYCTFWAMQWWSYRLMFACIRSGLKAVVKEIDVSLRSIDAKIGDARFSFPKQRPRDSHMILPSGPFQFPEISGTKSFTFYDH